MNYELLLLAAFMLAGPAKAQHLPAIEDYPEPLHVAPQADTARWNTLDEGLHLTWASRDEHYALHEIPEVQQQTEAVMRAWRGERANIQPQRPGAAFPAHDTRQERTQGTMG